MAVFSEIAKPCAKKGPELRGLAGGAGGLGQR